MPTSQTTRRSLGHPQLGPLTPALVVVDKGQRAEKVSPLLQSAAARIKHHELTDALLVQLIDSLALASLPKKQELETLLATFGEQYPDQVVPQLLNSLLHHDISVRSTVAMVLIRLGACVVPVLRQFYRQKQHHPGLHHAASLILDQLGQSLVLPSEVSATVLASSAAIV